MKKKAACGGVLKVVARKLIMMITGCVGQSFKWFSFRP